MNVSSMTGKLKGQIHVFSGKLSESLPKVAGRFLEKAIFGICVRQSLRLSEWGRCLNEKISFVKTIGRLSRQLDRRGLWEEILWAADVPASPELRRVCPVFAYIVEDFPLCRLIV